MSNSWELKLEEYGMRPNQEVVEQISIEVQTAIESGRPIQFIHSNNHLGDHMIINSALNVILSRFAEIRNLPKPVISQSKEKYLGSLDIERLITTWNVNHLVYESAISNIYHAYLLWFGDHLGIQLTKEDFLVPPKLYRTDFELSPLTNFSLDEVYLEVERLKSKIDPDYRHCIVLHGGSKPAKRFGRNQVRDVTKTLGHIFPRNKFILLTAQAVDSNGGPPLNEGDADLIVDATENINTTAAVFLLSNVGLTYVASDTFLAWLGASMISLRKDRANGILLPQDMYVINTLASATYWGIPGVNHCESLVIESLKAKGRLMTSSDNIIYDHEYYEFHGYHSFSRHEPAHISEEDIAKFLRYIVTNNAYNPIR